MCVPCYWLIISPSTVKMPRKYKQRKSSSIQQRVNGGNVARKPWNIIMLPSSSLSISFFDVCKNIPPSSKLIRSLVFQLNSCWRSERDLIQSTLIDVMCSSTRHSTTHSHQISIFEQFKPNGYLFIKLSFPHNNSVEQCRFQNDEWKFLLMHHLLATQIQLNLNLSHDKSFQFRIVFRPQKKVLVCWL